MESWWGSFSLAQEEVVKKQIGPLSLVISQEMREWRIYYERSPEWSENEVEREEEILARFCADAETLQERYVLANAPRQMEIYPALADRPVVAQPEKPFYIPTQQHVTLFISTPLWLKITYDEGRNVLTEIPIIRPSDTWFGPNTMEGESCYASRTRARLNPEELPRRFHRAITPVQIYNESSSHLLLEKINLPVPFLGLYESRDKQLWTQEVKLVKEKNEVTAGLEILPGPPLQILQAKRLADSRLRVGGNTIIRKISGFLG